MITKYLLVDKNVDNLETYPQIQEAAALLRKNEVVAFPTETVYGLGGNANSDEAVVKIYEARGTLRQPVNYPHCRNGTTE